MIAPLRVPETVEPQYRQPSYEFLGAMHASAAPPALEGHFKVWESPPRPSSNVSTSD